MKIKIDKLKALSLFSIALLFFAYGMAAEHYKLFPYSIIRNANQALDALLVVYDRDEQASQPQAENLAGAAVRNISGHRSDGFILITGGPGYLKKHSTHNGCLAWLMDRAGEMKHVWHYDPAIWDDLKGVATIGDKSVIYPIGLHLYEDGGILVSFQGRNCFPYAIGIARFDRDSNLIWKKQSRNHHWFSVGSDGKIYVPSLRVVDSPLLIPGTAASISTASQKLLSDSIMILNPDGSVVDEIPMLEALANSGWIGLWQGAPQIGDGTPEINVDSDDPTHLNDVRIVTEQLSAELPGVKTGDLLVSFRSLNAVGILDPETRRFKWMSAGATLRQHSPRFYNAGVLMFDNMGGSPVHGGARLLWVDLATRTPKTLFPWEANPIHGPFRTTTAGHIDLDAANDRALVTLTDQGAVWEVDLMSGKVLWEYVYAYDGERRLFGAQYVDEVSFPMNVEKSDP